MQKLIFCNVFYQFIYYSKITFSFRYTKYQQRNMSFSDEDEALIKNLNHQFKGYGSRRLLALFLKIK